MGEKLPSNSIQEPGKLGPFLFLNSQFQAAIIRSLQSMRSVEFPPRTSVPGSDGWNHQPSFRVSSPPVDPAPGIKSDSQNAKYNLNWPSWCSFARHLLARRPLNF